MIRAVGAYLIVGQFIAMGFADWDVRHCPQPHASITDVEVMSVTYGLMFPVVLIYLGAQKIAGVAPLPRTCTL